jgi:Fic family protein
MKFIDYDNLHTYPLDFSNNFFVNNYVGIETMLKNKKNDFFDYAWYSAALIRANVVDDPYSVYRDCNEQYLNKKVDNLIASYEYAFTNQLNENNLKHCHKLISSNLLSNIEQGNYRDTSIGIIANGKLLYSPIAPRYIVRNMRVLFEFINDKIQEPLKTKEVFYYASIIHLNFVSIHPFYDCNGRIARLLDKWFISTKLGNHFWKMPSEKYYSKHWKLYYLNINKAQRNPSKSYFFASMLQNCLEEE